MCGRFVRFTPIDVLIEWFAIEKNLCDAAPSYNIAPTQDVAAILHDGARRLECLRWGLIPFWAKDPSIGNRMINARAETITEKPSFRRAFVKRRCAIPADGYYEWRQEANGKVPVFFYLNSREPFAFAGLYETWKSPDGDVIKSCTIITTEPNEVAATAHHRMPAILTRERVQQWLDPDAQEADLLELLKPIPDELLACHEVSRLVNSPRNDVPECVAPVAT